MASPHTRFVPSPRDEEYRAFEEFPEEEERSPTSRGSRVFESPKEEVATSPRKPPPPPPPEPEPTVPTVQKEEDEKAKVIEATTKSHHQPKIQSAAFALTESHLLVILADIAFVVSAVFSCMVASSLVHPRFAPTPLEENLMVGWFAIQGVFLILWIILRFFIQNRESKWRMSATLPAIRKTYLRSWFVYDLLYVVPVEWIFAGWLWNVFWIFQLKHMLRLIRMFWLGRSGNPLLSTRLWLRFASIVAFIVYVVHAAALIFWSLEEKYNYWDSIYWSVVTMTTVGYGDVVPTRHTSSQGYAMFAMCLGICVTATVTAFATSFLTSTNKLSEEHEGKKLMMHAMMEYYNLPWEVQQEVIELFPLVLDAESDRAFRTMVGDLPPFLHDKIERYVRVKMLRKVTLFRDVDVDTLMAFATKLSRVSVPHDGTIFEAGDAGREMYFLLHGTADMVVPFSDLHEDLLVAKLRAGDYFGEAAIVTQQCVREATIRATSSCSLLKLTREDFDAIMKSDETEGNDVSRIVTERLTNKLEEDRVAVQDLLINASHRGHKHRRRQSIHERLESIRATRAPVRTELKSPRPDKVPAPTKRAL